MLRPFRTYLQVSRARTREWSDQKIETSTIFKINRMVKYTVEQLLDSRDLSYKPKPDVLNAFHKMVDAITEHTERKVKVAHGDSYIDENGNERAYSHLNRRRLSRSSNGTRPNLRKKSEPTVDQDGWATYVKPKKSFGAEDGAEDRAKFRDQLKDTTVKVRPNNKNLGSSKAVDPRDAIADKQTNTFNAFEALGGDDDE